MTIDAELMRETERRRLRALVEADMAAAEPLHAADYQLITPAGHALSKADYLGSIAAGELRYEVFEAASPIAVRGSGPVALLRYQARITVAEDAAAAVSITCWHTDCYELRDDRWQAVWSQATAIRPAS